MRQKPIGPPSEYLTVERRGASHHEVMEKWRLYLDTSVFGGVFDLNEESDADSRRMLDAVIEGHADGYFDVDE
ncbi:MAG: hypothetical protein K1X53_01935 [Candidatus Sumerlaeaceae bacterium]|nr:hypothetical protein [Candidatus Sumerlaeaceae bacterium]